MPPVPLTITATAAAIPNPIREPGTPPAPDCRALTQINMPSSDDRRRARILRTARRFSCRPAAERRHDRLRLFTAREIGAEPYNALPIVVGYAQLQ